MIADPLRRPSYLGNVSLSSLLAFLLSHRRARQVRLGGQTALRSALGRARECDSIKVV